MSAQEMQALKHILEKEKMYSERQKQEQQYRGIEVTEAIKNPNGSVRMMITVFEEILNDNQTFKRAMLNAVQETVQQIASVIINDRRQEIEDACNFGELRDVLAAELARQFMASRLTGAPTPFDAAKNTRLGPTAYAIGALAGTSQP